MKLALVSALPLLRWRAGRRGKRGRSELEHLSEERTELVGKYSEPRDDDRVRNFGEDGEPRIKWRPQL
jgi:hypothetical protein